MGMPLVMLADVVFFALTAELMDGTDDRLCANEALRNAIPVRFCLKRMFALALIHRYDAP